VARIIICWHFCWHSRVEDFQTLQFQLVKFGGEGRNRTRIPSFPAYFSRGSALESRLILNYPATTGTYRSLHRY